MDGTTPQILTVTAPEGKETRVCVIPKKDTSVEDALNQAEKVLGSENVIMIQEGVRNLDSKTILDHETNYYIATY